jgi:hypothetical protein|tara:strand:- start:1404 stop:1697 length:294 start_codon:yes stop_codon:yes gene_type:complete
MPVYILGKSKRKGKRFVLMKDGIAIHFGSDIGSTFIEHGDEKKRKAWEARHKMDKGYNDKNSGIYYSRYLLWGDNDNLYSNIKALNKKDGIHIKMTK